jgi:hypothetical protein
MALGYSVFLEVLRGSIPFPIFLIFKEEVNCVTEFLVKNLELDPDSSKAWIRTLFQ